MSEKMELNFDEIDEENFKGYIALENLTIEIEGTTWTDEIENLYGDQVSSVSLVAYFDTLTNYGVFDENGIELSFVDLNLAHKITKFLKDNMDEEIDSTSYEVNYSPKYYDLV